MYTQRNVQKKIKILIASMDEYRGKLMSMDEFLRHIGYKKIERCDNKIQKKFSSCKIEFDTPSTDTQSSSEDEKSEELSEGEIEILKDLLDYIDEQLGTTHCKNDLSLTKSFLMQQVSPKDMDKLVKWLENHGGYCDCEVLANIDEVINKQSY